MTTLDRLDATLRAVNPNIAGVYGDGPANAGVTWAVGYTPSAGEITAITSALAAFNWAGSAQTTWENLQARAAAIVALANPESTYKLLRAAFGATRDEVNILRAIVVGVGSAVWDPASIANGAGLTSPAITVTGAAFGDLVHPAAPYTLAGLTATAYVSAANTIVLRLENQTGAAVNLASGTWTAVVLRLGVMAPRTLAQLNTAITNRVNDGTVDS